MLSSHTAFAEEQVAWQSPDPCGPRTQDPLSVNDHIMSKSKLEQNLPVVLSVVVDVSVDVLDAVVVVP